MTAPDHGWGPEPGDAGGCGIGCGIALLLALPAAALLVDVARAVIA